MISQAIYAFGLVLLFGLHGRSVVAWALLADFLAILVVMGAMDLGFLVREPGNDQPTASVMVIWCVTAAVLAMQPGLGRVLAVLSVPGIAAFSATLFWGVEVSTTSAIVNAIALIQIAVACFGSSGDDGGDGRRVSVGQIPVAVSRGGLGMVASILQNRR